MHSAKIFENEVTRMAYFFEEPSHTFSEYLLVPGYSSEKCIPANVSLRTPVVRYHRGEECPLTVNIPMVSAVMQAVSGSEMGIALAREGGIAFLYGSQPIDQQAEMVRTVKSYKAGFVGSDSNLQADHTLADVLALKARTGHSTMAVTDNGTAHGKLVGLVTSRDYRVSRMDPDTRVREFMTPMEKIISAPEGTSLKAANDIIWEHKLNALPIVSKDGRLVAFVFRKDYDTHKSNPMELLDSEKRYVVGAGINTRDYEERVPALVEAGVDVLVMDSSEGYSFWQKKTLDWIRSRYGNRVKVGAGNVVDSEGFRFLADAGADFVKIGIGGGSICITRETKGIGRGQATAVIDVARERDRYFEETGIYVPVCADGGIVQDYHITLALAMGADFCMLGRYFSRFDESPSDKVLIGGSYMKEYWGEGSSRARNWQRYDLGGDRKLSFEEGVDSYVPYAGSLSDGIATTLSKIRSTMCNCGALTIPELREKAKLTLVSSVSIVEGGAHDVLLKDTTNSSGRT
jgi:IMP dehydrogenase